MHEGSKNEGKKIDIILNNTIRKGNLPPPFFQYLLDMVITNNKIKYMGQTIDVLTP